MPQTIATANVTRLREMTSTTPTALWNDSCSLEELSSSIAQNGAVGATANPVIVLGVLKKELALWKDRIPEIIKEMRVASEDGVAWRLVEEMSVKAAKLLEPIFQREKGRNGRLSVQTDPRLYRDAAAIVQQAERFDALAPNIITKIPVTNAGIPAIEEATYRGISINATVSFTLPQAIAVAEAVERGLSRREKEGKDISRMGPVCTLMVGRLDDWLKVACGKEGHHCQSRLPGLGRGRRVQESLQHLSGARVQAEAPFRGIPQPSPLVRADRRGRGDLPALRMAEAIQ